MLLQCACRVQRLLHGMQRTPGFCRLQLYMTIKCHCPSNLHEQVHQRLDALGNAPLHACRTGVQRVWQQRRINGGAVAVQEAHAAIQELHPALSGGIRAAGWVGLRSGSSGWAGGVARV